MQQHLPAGFDFGRAVFFADFHGRRGKRQVHTGFGLRAVTEREQFDRLFFRPRDHREHAFVRARGEQRSSARDRQEARGLSPELRSARPSSRARRSRLCPSSGPAAPRGTVRFRPRPRSRAARSHLLRRPPGRTPSGSGRLRRRSSAGSVRSRARTRASGTTVPGSPGGAGTSQISLPSSAYTFPDVVTIGEPGSSAPALSPQSGSLRPFRLRRGSCPRPRSGPRRRPCRVSARPPRAAFLRP